MSTSLFISLVLVINCLIIILLVLIFRLIKKEKELLEIYKHKPEEDIIRNTRDKSQTILHEALKKAQDIITDSELKGLKVLSAEKLTGKNIKQHYEQDAKDLENALKLNLENQSKSAQKIYNDFINIIDEKIRSHISGNEKILEKKSGDVINNAQKSLTEFTKTMENKVTSEVETEMQTAKKEVDEYRKKRMKVIDEKIIDILEEVIFLTVSKKMSINDQSEFVYKALEEAKKNHAL